MLSYNSHAVVRHNHNAQGYPHHRGAHRLHTQSKRQHLKPQISGANSKVLTPTLETLGHMVKTPHSLAEPSGANNYPGPDIVTTYNPDDDRYMYR